MLLGGDLSGRIAVWYVPRSGSIRFLRITHIMFPPLTLVLTQPMTPFPVFRNLSLYKVRPSQITTDSLFVGYHDPEDPGESLMRP